MAMITWEFSADAAEGSSREAFIGKLYELAKEHENLVFICTDSSPDGGMQDKFRKAYPDRMLDVGIMEQHAVGMAAGAALTGKKVFCQAFGPFLATRAVEQVYIDGAYNDAPVTFIGTHSGVTAAAGATHAAIMDIAYMRAMPNMTIIAPADADQICKIMEAALVYPHPIYVRCARGVEPLVYKDTDYPYEIGKAITVHEGSDITLIGTGSTVYHCARAAEMLAEDGISARVLDMHTVKPLDEAAILKAAKETSLIITAEDHNILCGLGGAVSEVVCSSADSQCRVQVKRLGVPDTFWPEGEPEALYDLLGYDYNAIYKAAKKLFIK